MMTATDHPLVRDYLARLREEARRLPVDQARELEADITEHLQVALGEDPAEVPVRDALDRLGSPGELVAEAAGTTAPVVSTDERRPFSSPVGAIGCLIAAELLALLVPIAFVLWVVGLVLLARATVWSEREKLLGFLGLGSGFFVSLAATGPGSGRRADDREWVLPEHHGRRDTALRLPARVRWHRCPRSGRPDPARRLSGLPGLHCLAAGPGCGSVRNPAISGPISRSALPRCEIASLSGDVSSAVVTPGASSASNTTS